MAGSTPEGPYMNGDGDWWVPVEGIPLSKARSLVVSCLSYSIPDDGRLSYEGKEMQWLDSEHEGHDDTGDCPSNRRVLAWHFEERRDW